MKKYLKPGKKNFFAGQIKRVHVSWVVRFESGLKKIDFRSSNQSAPRYLNYQINLIIGTWSYTVKKIDLMPNIYINI